MYSGHRFLGVILARGGSVGVPRKNILPLGGKPLLTWSIEAARDATTLDRVVLSTEDDQIRQLAESVGCEVPFRRPSHLAADDVPAIDPVLHAVEELPGFDYVVVLQATSPFRTGADIDACIEKCIDERTSSCVSVTKPAKSPYWMFRLAHGDRLDPVMGSELEICLRQNLPPCYALNGAIYVANVANLKQTRKLVSPDTVGYVMPPERSVDIDTELDFRVAEAMLDVEMS